MYHQQTPGERPCNERWSLILLKLAKMASSILGHLILFTYLCNCAKVCHLFNMLALWSFKIKKKVAVCLTLA